MQGRIKGLPQIAQRYPEQPPRKYVHRKHMLIPKQPPGWDFNIVNCALATYSPAERRVLNKVAETADIVEVDGEAAYLLIPSTPELLDDLAEVGAQFTDLDEHEDIKAVNEDGETGTPDLELDEHGFSNPAF